MRKKEQLLWDAMKRNAPSYLWLQRMENIAGDGIPDVYVGASGKWVELKAPTTVPKRAATPLLGAEGLRVSQRNWFLKNNSYTNAPRAYILIRTPALELLLIPGSYSGLINEMTLSQLRISSIACGWFDICKELEG
jgi:hypothetical protein